MDDYAKLGATERTFPRKPSKAPPARSTLVREARKSGWCCEDMKNGLTCYCLQKAIDADLASGEEPKPTPWVVPEYVDIDVRQSVIDEAIKIVRGNREGVYGPPTQNFETIASFWSAWLSIRLKTKITLEPADVGQLMVLVKSARMANAPRHRDSLVDLAGYADCIEKCWEAAP